MAPCRALLANFVSLADTLGTRGGLGFVIAVAVLVALAMFAG
jgi:hypothetical protein